MPKRSKTETVRLWPYLMLLAVISLLIGRFSLQRNVPDYPELPRSVDVVVFGSGITGATAALSAAEAGAEVFYIHASEPDTGGFPAFSPAFWAAGTAVQAEAGLDYTAEDMAMEIYSRGEEAGNLPLIQRISELSAATLAWIEHLSGIPFSVLSSVEINPGLHLPERGEARRFLTPEIGQRAEARVLETSQTLQPEQLLVEEGRVRGVVVRNEEGQTEKIYARAVILADGGYGANPEMLADLAEINNIVVRPEGGHEGVGLRLAMEAGAETLHLERVTLLPVFLPHGHSVPQEGFPGAVIVNEAGEVITIGEDLVQPIREAGGKLFVIYGSQNAVTDSNFSAIEDLMSLASGLGVEIATAGEITKGLSPPYYVAVVGTVALTPGGLAINEQMQVLQAD
jgi:fumarate reductase flavoprotein subunit